MVYRLLSVTLFVALASVTCLSQTTKSTAQSSDAVATAQRLHDELNKLEVAGDLEGQAKYFHDDVVRMDSFRPILKGKQAWLSVQTNLRKSRAINFKVHSISTQVINAWQEGDRLYEYGSTDMVASIGGASVRDPVDYFAVWRINPGSTPQVEFIIWNSTKPIEQLKSLSAASAR